MTVCLKWKLEEMEEIGEGLNFWHNTERLEFFSWPLWLWIAWQVSEQPLTKDVKGKEDVSGCNPVGRSVVWPDVGVKVAQKVSEALFI